MLLALVDIANLLLSIVTWIIIGQVILAGCSPSTSSTPVAAACAPSPSRIDRITAPLYRPIRRMLPDFGGIDFSPLVVLILIQVIRKLLAGVVHRNIISADDRHG